jgi:hypothetical protein
MVRAEPLVEEEASGLPGVSVMESDGIPRVFTMDAEVLHDPHDALDWAVIVATKARGVRA